MSDRKTKQLLDATTTRELLERFLADDIDPAEEMKLFETADRVVVRAFLVERLLDSGLTAGDRMTVAMLFAQFGLGEAGERLHAIAGDLSMPIAARSTICNILMEADSDAAESLFVSLTPEDRDAILKQGLADQIIAAHCGPQLRKALAEVLLRADEDQSKPIAMIEDVRRSLKIPATPLYSAVLRDRRATKELRQLMLQAIADDGSIGALELLESLEKKRDWRERVRVPLMRVRTRIAERQAVDGRGFLSPWVNGEWVALVQFKVGELWIGGGLHIVNDAVGGGFAGSGGDAAAAIHRSDVSLAEVTPEESYAAVELLIRNTDLRKVDDDTRAAIEIFKRVSHSVPLETPRPCASAEASAIEALFNRSEYSGLLFTMDQFLDAGLDRPTIPPSARWKEESLRKLAAIGAREQLALGAEYMARWHAARGETNEAEIAAKLAVDFRSKFEQSAVVRRLLERSAEALTMRWDNDEPLDDDDEFFEDDEEEEFERAGRVHEILLPVVDKQRRSRGGVPEVKATYDRLIAAGIEKNRARDLIAMVLQCETRLMLSRELPHDPARYGRLLDTLPDLDALTKAIVEIEKNDQQNVSLRELPPMHLEFERLEDNEWLIVENVSDAAEKSFEAGMDAFDDGDLNAAERHYRRALELDPNHVDALHHIAVIAYRKQDGQALAAWESACARIMESLPEELRNGSDHLRWGWLENRPFLRVCHGVVLARLEAGQADSASEMAERLLRWNPDDNQGARALAIEAAFDLDKPDVALNVCDRYPDDSMVDVLYGRVLALWLLGREEEARSAARAAASDRPLVAKELLASTHKRPKMNPDFLTFGGADEAFVYWESCGDFWETTRGALELLREATLSARKPAKSPGANRPKKRGK